VKKSPGEKSPGENFTSPTSPHFVARRLETVGEILRDPRSPGEISPLASPTIQPKKSAGEISNHLVRKSPGDFNRIW
jgi:hypothetical protein